MALKIRLARGGAKKRPFYRIVVAEASSPRDGRFVERIGSYNPFLEKDNAERVVIKKDRAEYWLGQGAQPTDRVALFLAKLDLVKAQEKRETPKQSAPKKKAQERLAEQNAKQEQAAAAEAEAKANAIAEAKAKKEAAKAEAEAPVAEAPVENKAEEETPA